jgi:hypothetical protein
MVQAYDKSGTDPEDLENAIEAYEGVFHILNDKDLVSWDIEQDIPDRFKLAMTALTARQLLPMYLQYRSYRLLGLHFFLSPRQSTP